MDADEIDRYTTVEIEDLLSNLVQDKASLARIYRYYRGLGCELRTGLTAKDIMGEVWVDTLSGKRVWKRGIDALKHFKEVGRSIISNVEEKLDRLEFIESEDHLYGEGGRCQWPLKNCPSCIRMNLRQNIQDAWSNIWKQ
jgi:hypothetical protein